MLKLLQKLTQKLSIKNIVILGVVVMAFVVFLALLFSFLGLKQTNPIVSSLLFLASPLTTIVMNMLYFKEYISKHNILALFLMCVGAFILHFLSSI